MKHYMIIKDTLFLSSNTCSIPFNSAQSNLLIYNNNAMKHYRPNNKII